ncbi:putative rad21/Rec8-like protein [Dioscorea sansibarensis]
MFYSHTFLAKKSPLGTIWIAAHLERRIKRPQIEGIDIPSYADCIMFPEVPIALRLSGHLLLGLVKIYSWKVNYLFQDCNRVLSNVRTAIASVQVDLPPDANRAPFESITLPNTFALDALELDESTYDADGPDKHRTSYEDITLSDTIPAEGAQYEAFYLEEEFRFDPTPQPVPPDNDVIPMDEEYVQILLSRLFVMLPSAEADLDPTATPMEHVMAPANQDAGSIPSLNEAKQASQEFPEVDVMRDALDNPDPVAFQESPIKNMGSGGTADTSILSPPVEHVMVPEAGPASSTAHVQTSATAGSLDDPKLTNTGFTFCYVLKRVMREQLDDTTRLVKKRVKLPGSNLDIWKFRKTQQKENIFNEPLLSGMSNDFQKAFNRTFSRVNVNNPFGLEALPKSPRLPNAEAQNAVPELEIQPEQAQSDHQVDMDLPDFTTPDVDRSPKQPQSEEVVGGNLSDLVPSPNRGGDFTQFDSNIGSTSHVGGTFGTETMPAFEPPASAEPYGLEPETPLAHSEQWPVNDPVPEYATMQISAEKEELSFLESSNASSDSEQLKVENMSSRTRAVAQYLKTHSPTTQASKDPSGTLSLNKILEGKTRKICARMFFETTVLKSCNLIDVKQDEPYGDISILLKPSLSTTEL